MFEALRAQLIRWLGHPASREPGSIAPAPQTPEQPVFIEEPVREATVSRTPALYDEALLERARTQWQFGDWASLTTLSRDRLEDHPDRAKLALLAAAGHLQSDNPGAARQFIRLAQEWGCSKKLVTQILTAGVHNSLGRAAAIAGHNTKAIAHFENAIVTGTPGAESRLLTKVRIAEQYSQLGLGNAFAESRGGSEGKPRSIPAPIAEAGRAVGALQAASNSNAQLKARLQQQLHEVAIVRTFLDSSVAHEQALAAAQGGNRRRKKPRPARSAGSPNEESN